MTVEITPQCLEGCSQTLGHRVQCERFEPLLGLVCPDSGTCHHACASECWRVNCANPVGWARFPGDRWPFDVREAHGALPPLGALYVTEAGDVWRFLGMDDAQDGRTGEDVRVALWRVARADGSRLLSTTEDLPDDAEHLWSPGEAL